MASEPDDGSRYPDEYSDTTFFGMKRHVFPYPDGFIDES